LHIYSQYITNISIAHGTKTKPKPKIENVNRKTKEKNKTVFRDVCDERCSSSKTNIQCV